MKKFIKGFILTILITILLFTFSFLLILIPIKNNISKDGVKNMISKINIEEKIAEDPSFKETIDEIVAPIYEETRNLGIDDEVIIKIIDSKEVKDLIGNVSGNLMDYIVTGENQKLINAKDIDELISTAMDDINESGYYEIKEEDQKQILKVIKEEVNEYQEILPDTSIIDDSLTKEEQNTLNIFRFILGNKLITILIAIIVICSLSIILLNLKKLKWLKVLSITILASSLFVVIFSLFLKFGLNLLKEQELKYIIDIFKNVINYSLILSLSIVIITIILLIVYKVITKEKLKNN